MIQSELGFSIPVSNGRLFDKMRLNLHYSNFERFNFHWFDEYFIDNYFAAVTNEGEASFFVFPLKSLTNHFYQVWKEFFDSSNDFSKKKFYSSFSDSSI